MKKLMVGILLIVLLTSWRCALADELPSHVESAELQRSAASISEDKAIQLGVCATGKLPAQTRYLCVNCYVQCVTVCANERNHYDTGTHGSCQVRYLNSYGALMCPVCTRIWQQYETRHDCWELHSSCFKGDYRVCMFRVK